MKILSVNGGGALGLIPAVFIREMEKSLGKPSYEIFNLVSGVSTGSIIAAGIAKGMTGEDIVNQYKVFIPEIFGKPNAIWKIWASKYDSTILKRVCKTLLDYPMNEAKTKLMLHAVNISKPTIEPKFWKSWKETIPTWEAVVASCSAPTFFDAHKIGDCVYVDGSLATNNTSMCAIAEALRLGEDLDKTSLVNIACCKAQGYDDAEKIKGIFGWISKIASAMITASDPLATYQCDQLIDNHFIIKPNFDAPLDFQDLKKMERVGLEMWAANEKDILERFK
jgi:uncharacterized protein